MGLSTLVRCSLIYSTYSFSLAKQENSRAQTLHKLEEQICHTHVFPDYFLYYLPEETKRTHQPRLLCVYHRARRKQVILMVSSNLQMARCNQHISSYQALVLFAAATVGVS